MGIRIDFIQLYKRERLWSQTDFGGPSPSPTFPRILANAKLLITVLHMTFPFQPPWFPIPITANLSSPLSDGCERD